MTVDWQRTSFDHWDELDQLVTVEAPPSPVDCRYHAIIETLGLQPGDRLTMVMRTDGEYPGNDDIPAIVRSLDPFVERGQALGIDMDVAPVHWLAAEEDGRLHNQGRPVDAVVRAGGTSDASG